MSHPRQKSVEQFVAQSPVGERIVKGVFDRNLAKGALRLVEVNGEPITHHKLGNNEAKVREVLDSGYFGIVDKNPEFIKADIEQLLIEPDDIPESYFNLQRRIARE